MKLNIRDEEELHKFIMQRRKNIENEDAEPSEEIIEILRKAEIGAYFFAVESTLTLQTYQSNLLSATPNIRTSAEEAGSAPVSVVFRENSAANLRLIDSLALIEGMEIYVLVSRSWRCYINCGDEILSAVCEEMHNDTAKCCEALRGRCSVSSPVGSMPR